MHMKSTIRGILITFPWSAFVPLLVVPWRSCNLCSRVTSLHSRMSCWLYYCHCSVLLLCCKCINVRTPPGQCARSVLSKCVQVFVTHTSNTMQKLMLRSVSTVCITLGLVAASVGLSCLPVNFCFYTREMEIATATFISYCLVPIQTYKAQGFYSTTCIILPFLKQFKVIKETSTTRILCVLILQTAVLCQSCRFSGLIQYRGRRGTL